LSSGITEAEEPHGWLWQGFGQAISEHTAGDIDDWNAVMELIRADHRDRPGDAGVPRWLGLVSYEAGRLFEPSVGDAGAPDPIPLARFWRLSEGCTELEPETGTLPRAQAIAVPGAEEHMERIQECRHRIGQGEIYQANLSRRIHLTFEDEVDGLRLARTLQAREQHSYAAWLKLGPEIELVSLSPECLLRGALSDDRIQSFPIKGTARPGCTEVEADPKERAEHVMIVDLVRNDLGRVAQIGSVYVDPLLGPRDMRTLRHLESTVHGILKPEFDVLDALEVLLPGGSITGAPKIQSTRVIADLEKVPRGAYTGSLVSIDASGALVASLLIRTLVLYGDRGHLDVGGGIVWGSDPQREVEETRRKALAHLDGVVAEIP